MKRHIQLVTMGLLTALTLAVLTTSSATAAGWHINGTELKKGSKEQLTTASTIDTAATLSIVAKSEKITVRCSGTTLDWTNPEIIGTNEGMAKSLTLTDCATTKPATKCALTSSSISTNPIKITVTKGAGESNIDTVKSLSEEPLVELGFSEKNTCAFSESQPIAGTFRLNAPTGQTEEELQAIEGLGSIENNSLEISGDKVYLEGGKALEKLTSGSKWSFR